VSSGYSFKVSQLRNYFLKKFNISIFNALNTQFFIKIYYLKFLKNALRTLLNFSLDYIVVLEFDIKKGFDALDWNFLLCHSKILDTYTVTT